MDEQARQQIDEIWRLLRGNGGKGAFERIRLLETAADESRDHFVSLDEKMDSLQTQFNKFLDERREEKAEWRGMRRILITFGTILTFLVGGGYIAIARTLRAIINGL